MHNSDAATNVLRESKSARMRTTRHVASLKRIAEPAHYNFGVLYYAIYREKMYLSYNISI